MSGLGTTAAGSPTQSQPDTDDLVTDDLVTAPDQPARQRKHPFFQRSVTPAHRRTLFTKAIELLAARLPASQSHLDPVIHYTPWVHDFLDWLDAQPGDTYQDRWLASGADSAGRDWLDVITSDLSVTYTRQRFNRSLEAVVCCGVIRPSYGFLLTVWSNRLWSTWREEHDTELFSVIRKTAAEELGRRPEMTSSTLIDFARMSIRTGKALGELTCTDLLDYRQACIDAKGPGTKISWATTYYCGRAAGLFGDGPDEFQALLTARQLSPAEMVDHHHIASLGAGRGESFETFALPFGEVLGSGQQQPGDTAWREVRLVVEMSSLVEVSHEEVVAAVVAQSADFAQQRGSPDTRFLFTAGA